VTTGAVVLSTTVQDSDHDGLIDVWKANQGYCDAGANRGILAGVRAVRADDFLRPVMISTVSFGFLLRVLMLALPVLAFDRFGGDAKVGGVLLAGFGAGAIAGAAVSYLVGSRLSPSLAM